MEFELWFTLYMPANTRTPDAQKFWDRTFRDAYRDALRRNGKRSDASRITWAATRADGALIARSRSQQENQQ